MATEVKEKDRVTDVDCALEMKFVWRDPTIKEDEVSVQCPATLRHIAQNCGLRYHESDFLVDLQGNRLETLEKGQTYIYVSFGGYK